MMIGVFDSGLGGLTILKELYKELPEYDYLYLGDNARVPYGNRSNEVIYNFTIEAVEYLFKKGCVLVILACNSATAAALKKIQTEYLPKRYPQRRVLGIILPTVEAAIKNNTQRVGLIATYATVNSNSFPKEIHKLKPDVFIVQQACPLLVPIIEEGEMEWEGLELALNKYLSPIQNSRVESLILGCTHYGIIENNIKKILGENIKVISQGKMVAKKLHIYLNNHPDIKNRLSKNGSRAYLFTDFNDHYRKIARLFLKDSLDKHHQMKLIKLNS